MTERKYSVASIGPRSTVSCGPSGGWRLRLHYEIQDPQPADDDFETPDVVVKFSGPTWTCCCPIRPSCCWRWSTSPWSAARALRGPFAHFLRCQRLPPAADRGTALERHHRGRKGEAHRHAVPLQPHEQPRAPRHPPGVARETTLRSESSGAAPAATWWFTPPACRACPKSRIFPRALPPPVRRATIATAGRAATTVVVGAAIAEAVRLGGEGNGFTTETQSHRKNTKARQSSSSQRRRRPLRLRWLGACVFGIA